MGRKKLAIKLIEDKDSRYTTFSKRRAGLIKKAQELSVLCEVDVALLVFSSTGNPYHFCSGDSLNDLLKRYQIYLRQAQAAAVAENKRMEQSVDAWSSYAELLQRLAEKQEFEKLSVLELSGLEEQLSAALAQVRSKKERILNEENKHLKEMMNLLLLLSGNRDNPKDDAAAVDVVDPIGQEDDERENSCIQKATLPLLE